LLFYCLTTLLFFRLTVSPPYHSVVSPIPPPAVSPNSLFAFRFSSLQSDGCGVQPLLATLVLNASIPTTLFYLLNKSLYSKDQTWLKAQLSGISGKERCRPSVISLRMFSSRLSGVFFPPFGCFLPASVPVGRFTPALLPAWRLFTSEISNEKTPIGVSFPLFFCWTFSPRGSRVRRRPSDVFFPPFFPLSASLPLCAYFPREFPAIKFPFLDISNLSSGTSGDKFSFSGHGNER
jgi:hypothetical protein